VDICGYSPQDFYDDDALMLKIISPADREKWQCHQHGVLNTGAPEPIEFKILDRGGKERWIQHVCREIRRESGDILGIRGSNRDITELRQARDELSILRGLLPICAECKKIRDKAGNWQPMEVYIANHSEADFTHGYCPECGREFMKEIEDYQEQIIDGK
jgi:PAS domain S-box-containing protein